MSANLQEPFAESCCDGTSQDRSLLSAQPCGCDPGANWTCVQHALPIEPVKTAKAHFADTMNQLLQEDKRVMYDPAPRVRKYTPPSQIEPYPTLPPPVARTFDTGATRDGDTNKFDYEGFLSPLVLECFGRYMHKHRFQADGKMRDSDNWTKGIPKAAYVKSLLRHVMSVWLSHRGVKTEEDLETALCAVMFNAMGLLYETLKDSRS